MKRCFDGRLLQGHEWKTSLVDPTIGSYTFVAVLEEPPAQEVKHIYLSRYAQRLSTASMTGRGPTVGRLHTRLRAVPSIPGGVVRLIGV